MPIAYNKLVRDKIPEMIKDAGKEPITRVADNEEFIASLKSKLTEEVNEFLEADDPEELADILEVLMVISETKGLKWSEIETLAAKKREERGGFFGKIMLVEVKE